VILHRCLAWDRGAGPADAGGALWVPRDFQGDGRHDNPDAYGCLYASEDPVACVVEQLARFRGSVLVPGMLRRRGLPLALATLELGGRPALVDLDRPAVLRMHRLRPSLVATRRREITQPQALAIYRRGGDGIRWWSTFEALWANVTLFDRAVRRLRVVEVRGVRLDVPAVREACELLGIMPG
jgi:RES domain-containing protein